jgi:hypothetical protein
MSKILAFYLAELHEWEARLGRLPDLYYHVIDHQIVHTDKSSIPDTEIPDHDFTSNMKKSVEILQVDLGFLVLHLGMNCVCVIGVDNGKFIALNLV